MGIALFLVIVLQLACALHAVKLGRPAYWLPVILLVPILGVLAYCGFEVKQASARSRPARPSAPPARNPLGWLGYRAVRARTTDGRRALAEECLRVGRYADARLLFQSCMVGRHARDPRLIAGLEQATARMGKPCKSAESVDKQKVTIAL